jgi:O-antigen/teichoic acid export membrane protein
MGIVLIINTFIVVPVSLWGVSKFILPQNDWHFLLFSILIFNCTTVFSSVYRVFYAEHKGYYSNMIPACASVVTVAVLFCLMKFSFLRNNSCLYAVGAVFGIPLCAAIVGYLKVLRFEANFDYEFVLDLFRHGKYFFVFSVFAACTLQIDTLIISHYLSPQDLVSYNILTKIFGLIAFLYSAYIAAVMPVSAEMQRKGEYLQLNAIIKRNLLLGSLITLICTAGFIFLKNWLFNFFSKEPLSVGLNIVLMMCVYQLVRVWTDTYAMLLQSVNRMKRFIFFVFVQATLSVGFQIFFVRYFALMGILIGLILSYLLTVTWFLPYEYHLMEIKNAR